MLLNHIHHQAIPPYPHILDAQNLLIYQEALDNPKCPHSLQVDMHVCPLCNEVIVCRFRMVISFGVAVQSVQKVPVSRVNKINDLACV